MPTIRILKVGYNLAFRSKSRAIIFIILFILATVTTFLQSSRIYSFQTNDLIRLKSVILEPSSPITANALDSKIRGLFDAVRDRLSGFYVLYGFRMLGNQLLVLTVRDYRNLFNAIDYPWLISEFKPTSLIAGRYIQGNYEGLVNRDFKLNFSAFGYPVTVRLSMGDSLVFISGYREIRVNIVGVSSSDMSAIKNALGENIENFLFVDWRTFEEIAVNVMQLSTPLEESPDVHVLRIIMIVKGSIISALTSGDLFNNRMAVKSEVSKQSLSIAPLQLTQIEEINYGEFQSSLFTFIVSILFQLIVAGIYAVLIVRFHRRDIATLRAIGWNTKAIRVLSFGSFVSTLLIASLIGLIIGSTYIILIAKIPLELIPFIIVVISNILIPILVGFKYTSSATLSIPPSEAFRRE